MTRRFIVIVIIGLVPIRVHFLSVGLLGGLLARVPVGGRRIPASTLTG
jgi:hypothetical protein